MSDNIDFHAGDRIEIDIVGGMQDLIWSSAHIVERHRMEIGTWINHFARDDGAWNDRSVYGRERLNEGTAWRAIAIAVEQRAVQPPYDVTVDMQRNSRGSGQWIRKEQPRCRCVRSGDDGCR